MSAQLDAPTKSEKKARPPRDGLVRLWTPSKDDSPAISLRATVEDRGGDTGSTLTGHFCVWNRWTEIDSFFEGNFMERLAPGSAKKTFSENRDNIKVLFQHGRDPQIGSKPLGPIVRLEEDQEGGAYDVTLLDADYVRDTLLPGLRANLYGASFRFSVMREDWVQEPKPSDYNPQGLPERTIKEMRISEFGPVTFPAYPDATAGVRSVTDDFILDGLAHADVELVRMAADGASLQELLARRATPGTRATRFDTANTERTTAKENAPGCPTDMPHGIVNARGDLVGCHNSMDNARSCATALSGKSITKSTDDDSTESHEDEVEIVPEAQDEQTVEAREEQETQDDTAQRDNEDDKDEVVVATDSTDTARTESVRTSTNKSKGLAAPGLSPTPLLGNKKEPWRL